MGRQLHDNRPATGKCLSLVKHNVMFTIEVRKRLLIVYDHRTVPLQCGV